jgi:hypothetical protein
MLLRKATVLITSFADLNKPQGVKQIIEPKDESLLGAVSTLSLSWNTSTQAQIFNKNGQKSMLLALPAEISQLIFMYVAFPPQRNVWYNPKQLPKTPLDSLRPYIEANGEGWLNLSRWYYLVVSYSLLSQSMK